MTKESYVLKQKLPKFLPWEKRNITSFDLEVTARCNNNCRHCYINLPAQDKEAKKEELSFSDIKNIADEAVSLGALWCLITGGEPLLREDFFDIYFYLKKKGILISVFTNAALINLKHIRLFKKYPPRDIEVTVYGVTKDTYEKVTRTPGSYDAFMRGLNLLLQNKIKVRFKIMALRSNFKELAQIARFCKGRTKDFFRYDPFLNLRFDANKIRNEDIKSERLSPKEIVAMEEMIYKHSDALERACDDFIHPELSCSISDNIFRCSAGKRSFTVGYDGSLRICSALMKQDCVYNLKKGNLCNIWQDLIPQALDMRSHRKEFLNKCGRCSLIELCAWCPAYSYLETGEMDKPIEYFCEVTHAMAKLLSKYKKAYNV
jgi:radical SAM protein with 4Fe4S-binding SPASM domain